MTVLEQRRTGEAAFATSGHTGEPVVWIRTRAQLLAEVDLLARTIVGEFDQVVNFAPPEHLYGRLLGVELPRRFGVPVDHRWDLPLEAPEMAEDRRTLLVCLPSTWVMLRSLAPRLRRLPSAVAVHSAGPPVPATFAAAEAMRGSPFRLIELFGATETGAVAYRELTGADDDLPPWRLFDDVEVDFGPGGEQRLRVRGPRLARRSDAAASPEAVTLDDLVRPVGPRSFELVGRASGLIKVNGRRFQLERIEAALGRDFPDTEFACVLTSDDVRGQHYRLYCTDPAIDHAALTESLARSVPGVPQPRSIHHVEDLPRSSAGKIRKGRL
ncbi:hypothetical protein GCM10027447_18520 [Glycomyces halotolerans]